MDAIERAADWGVLPSYYSDVQRVRRARGKSVQRPRSEEELLAMNIAKVLLFAACLVPAALLVRGFMVNDLGVNPVETITHTTGDWTLRFLLISLCITPARKLLKKPELIRFRRMLGLFAFFYGFLHFMTWAWLDQELEFSNVVGEIKKRPFITAGAVSLFAMVPLAITSTAGWIRRMGGQRWQLLHR